MAAKQKLVVIHRQAPGDTVVLTGFVRDLYHAHSDRFDIFVRTSADELWQHNPYVRPAGALATTAVPDVQYYQADYGVGLRQQKHETVHFLRWFHRDFQEKFGLDVPLTAPWPDIHLSATEATPPVFARRYWLINAGGKQDAPTKVWATEHFQTVVDNLRAAGIICVQIGSRASHDQWHPQLTGVIDMVGKTDHRELIRLLKHADGVICGVTYVMHLAAALGRPCVVVAGGREAWWWEAYVRENRGLACAVPLHMPHRYLHTIGLLDCVPHHGGCWKKYVTPDQGRDSLCCYPHGMQTQTIPRCLALITPTHVTEAVMSYYQDQSLPPISQPPALTDAELKQAPAQLLTPQASGELSGPPSETSAPATLDDPIIGGQFTLCALLYGDYPEMHRQFLTQLQATLPPGRVEVRLGTNALGQTSQKLVQAALDEGWVTCCYPSTSNRRKYPVMRHMFHDPERPLTTSYVIWLDDDTLFDVDAAWLDKLAQTIVTHHPHGARLFGPLRFWDLQPGQDLWIQQADWYRGRMFHDSSRVETPHGRRVMFASGSFWALHTAVMRQQNIPDFRLGHNGGDYMIGAQVHQGGWKMASFSDHKEIVRWSAFPRRGLSEAHIGT